MENTQPIDSSLLQNLLKDSSANPVSLIPESLTNLLATALIVSLGLMAVFLLLYVLSMLRKRKVQSAILQMQKDVAEIKLHLAKPAVVETPETEAPTPSQDQPLRHL